MPPPRISPCKWRNLKRKQDAMQKMLQYYEKKNKQISKKKKKQKQKLTENNQIVACTIVVSVKNTQPRSHSSLREMRDRVTQYAIKLHA